MMSTDSSEMMSSTFESEPRRLDLAVAALDWAACKTMMNLHAVESFIAMQCGIYVGAQCLRQMINGLFLLLSGQ